MPSTMVQEIQNALNATLDMFWKTICAQTAIQNYSKCRTVPSVAELITNANSARKVIYLKWMLKITGSANRVMSFTLDVPNVHIQIPHKIRRQNAINVMKE